METKPMPKRCQVCRNLWWMMLFILWTAASVGAQEGSIQEAKDLDQQALQLYSQGRYGEAIPLVQRALAINEKVLGPEHPDTATSLNKLAGLYRTTGAYAQAEPLFQRALAIREKALGPEHPATARSVNNLAILYEATGAYAQAERLLRRALAIKEKVLGPDHPDTALSLNNLAGLYRMTGSYAQAEPLLQRALAIYEKSLGPEHPLTAILVNNLAGLSWATGKQVAVALSERAQAIREKNTAVMLLSGSEIRKQTYVQQFRWYTFENISMSLALAGRHAVGLGVTSVLQAKGRVLDAMADSVGRLRQSVKPEDRALFEQLTDVARQLSTLTYQGIGNRSPAAYRQRLADLSAQQEQLQTQLSTRSAKFRQQVMPVTVAAVQTALSKESVLMEWFRYQPLDPKAKDEQTKWGKPRYVAYALTHDGEPAVVEIGDAAAIERLIHDFRTGLSDPKSTYVNEVAKELYDKLVNPLRLYLGNATHLLISPDGGLNLVPFAALMDEKGEYLASKVEITYLTSGRDLLRFGTDAPARSSPTVIADPDYGKQTTLVAQAGSAIQQSHSSDLDRDGLVFKPLSGTAAEANALKALLKIEDEQILTQAAATEANLKQLRGPRILHVATHGFFLKDNELPTAALRSAGFSQDQGPLPLGENPLLRSGLALAGANARRSGEKDDGILTAAEVAQMDLRGTQLVVLSACETGVGEVQNGERVYGLRRALVLAGTETQVASLWKVADNATKDLMVDYYRRLLKGEGRSAALREAQRTMMKSSTRSHPYYWAAFVPIGDWRPLSKSW